jgi:hypothetical protein
MPWVMIRGLMLLCLAVRGAFPQDRIVTAEDIARATHTSWPWRMLSYPQNRVAAGMERGLIAFEKHKMRERFAEWNERLRARGVAYRFGGSGEGAGFGGGGTFTVKSVSFLGLATFKGYQEFGVQWTAPLGTGRLIAESSYQWRPEENFYGLGHNLIQGESQQLRAAPVVGRGALRGEDRPPLAAGRAPADCLAVG